LSFLLPDDMPRWNMHCGFPSPSSNNLLYKDWVHCSTEWCSPVSHMGSIWEYKNLYMVIGNSDAYGSIYSMDLGFAKYWNIDGLAANYPSISVRLYNNNTLNIFQMGTQTKFIRIFGF